MTTLLTHILGKQGVSEENRDLGKTADTFIARYKGADASVEKRRVTATTLVNEYYDLVTDFYEYGWGACFHFAPRYKGESFTESIQRHEFYLALRAGFRPDHRLIDVGCGVGGPLRNMARFTGAHITGINNNAYQISRSRKHDARLGLSAQTDYLRTDFNTMPIPGGTIDGAYAIEATCHAADKVKCYGEIYRVLKPGAVFACYEWVMTDKYDASNPEHRRVKHGIELGDGLPDLEQPAQVLDALSTAGFVVEDSFDMIEKFETGHPGNIPWYEPLQGSYTNVMGWKATPVGRTVTSYGCRFMEWAHLAAPGSVKAAEILEEAAANLVRGGQMQIFTPAYFFLARKPVDEK
jgi:sterol 24-C-methyltransferase